MKQFFIKKEITAVIFIISLVTFSVINCIYSWPFLKEELTSTISTQDIETKMNNELYQKNSYIESYGFIQSVLGKREFNNFEVIKGTDNMLYLTSQQTKPRDTSIIVERMKRLQDVVENNNGQLVTLVPPDKYLEGKSASLDGYPSSFNNETADRYVQGLKDKGIEVLDYREYFQKSSLSIQDIFYQTDHHWKIESAFLATHELINYLNEKDSLNLDPEYYYRDINNYNQMTYKKGYIGSLGRKTGKLYSGVEDFTLIYPKYETSFVYDMNHYGQTTHREGRMDDTLINPSYFVNIRKDYLSPQYDFYAAYLDYNCSYAKIVNNNNPTGLKVAFYKDSYSLPLITFFSQVCSEIEIIDPRYYDGNIDKYFHENAFDYVFVSISPDLIYEDSFLFYQE